jgi:hypothetical protein
MKNPVPAGAGVLAPLPVFTTATVYVASLVCLSVSLIMVAMLGRGCRRGAREPETNPVCNENYAWRD